MDSTQYFSNAEEWYTHYCRATDAGNGWQLQPLTREELELADEMGVLDRHPYWLPSAETLKYFGLPAWFGRKVEPLDELGQERFLGALVEDDGFRSAVVRILKRGAGK